MCNVAHTSASHAHEIAPYEQSHRHPHNPFSALQSQTKKLYRVNEPLLPRLIFSELVLKAYSHGAIFSDCNCVFITMTDLYVIQCKCSYGTKIPYIPLVSMNKL